MMRAIVLAAAIAATATAPALIAQRQNAPQPASNGRGSPPQGPAPKLVDGRPDFSGVWLGVYGHFDLEQRMLKGGEVPLNAAGKALMASRQSKDDPEANCLPTGVPRTAPYPWRMLQTPTHVFILFEGNIHSYRQIFVDGRKHPDDPDPTWYGHSIGHYEGMTLVVDTIGFNDKFWFDSTGRPHSEKLHTVERFTRTDLATLVVETTIDDPTFYTKPFTISYSARLRPGEELMEYICQENEQDTKHLQGPAGAP